MTRNHLVERYDPDDGMVFDEAMEPEDVPEGLATVADALLEGLVSLTRAVRTAFGAWDPPTGMAPDIRFLEGIGIALGGENLKTPLPEVISEASERMATATERAGDTIGEAIDGLAEAITTLTSKLGQ